MATPVVNFCKDNNFLSLFCYNTYLFISSLSRGLSSQRYLAFSRRESLSQLTFFFFFVCSFRLNLMHDDTQQRKQLERTPVMIGCYSKITRDPRKMRTGEGDLYAGGVSSLLLLKDGRLVVGTGDGTIELIEIISRKNGRTKKPSKFPNTPQILAVSCFNPLNTYVKSASIFFTDIYSSVACNEEK